MSHFGSLAHACHLRVPYQVKNSHGLFLLITMLIRTEEEEKEAKANTSFGPSDTLRPALKSEERAFN